MFLLDRIQARFALSRGKHPSLAGHTEFARRLAGLLPFYEYAESQWFRADGAPPEVEAKRRTGFDRLCATYREKYPKSVEATQPLVSGIADLAFTSRYRVPFQFSRMVRERLPVGMVVERTDGPMVTDLDGNQAFDLSGSYGVNLLGYEFYKRCIDRGIEQARALGPMLGPYHPAVADNVQRLQTISGHEQVSFHMSGTEAVMQAVRLARFHTGRTHIVRFAGAYHGWWDDVQPGPGSPMKPRATHTLSEMNPAALAALRKQRNVACVLINPLQALAPNKPASGDSTLVDSSRAAHYDRKAYTQWLQELRKVCDEKGIVLIFDEVFLGFRLAKGGAQAYFDVRADLVTYGKTLGGGLPVGVLCGPERWMRRFRDDRPGSICFARGTFNAHPYVMCTMNAFLRALDEDPELNALYDGLDARWDGRAQRLNEDLETAQAPVRVANMSTVWTFIYTQPARYNWMLQYYLRAEGLHLSWVGSGRIIFSLDYDDARFDEVRARIVAGAQAMKADGWWDHIPDGNKTIRRSVLKELARTQWMRWRERTPPQLPESTPSK